MKVLTVLIKHTLIILFSIGFLEVNCSPTKIETFPFSTSSH